MNKEIMERLTLRPEEGREIEVINRLIATLSSRVNEQAFDELQERQPLIMLLMRDYLSDGDFSRLQLEEIMQLLLLTWLFHEEYYGRVFRPVTDPELDAALTALERRLDVNEQMHKSLQTTAGVIRFLEDCEPRMLVAYIGSRLHQEPSPAMERLAYGKRLLLLLECMAFCACFRAQRQANG